MTTYERGVKKLEELEDLLYRIEKGNASKNTTLALARVIYFLLEQWVRDHEPKKNSIWRNP